jgi:hypothetical protein
MSKFEKEGAGEEVFDSAANTGTVRAIIIDS